MIINRIIISAVFLVFSASALCDDQNGMFLNEPGVPVKSIVKFVCQGSGKIVATITHPGENVLPPVDCGQLHAGNADILLSMPGEQDLVLGVVTYIPANSSHPRKIIFDSTSEMHGYVLGLIPTNYTFILSKHNL